MGARARSRSGCPAFPLANAKGSFRNPSYADFRQSIPGGAAAQQGICAIVSRVPGAGTLQPPAPAPARRSGGLRPAGGNVGRTPQRGSRAGSPSGRLSSPPPDAFGILVQEGTARVPAAQISTQNPYPRRPAVLRTTLGPVISAALSSLAPPLDAPTAGQKVNIKRTAHPDGRAHFQGRTSRRMGSRHPKAGEDLQVGRGGEQRVGGQRRGGVAPKALGGPRVRARTGVVP